jgi:hypothetical protein
MGCSLVGYDGGRSAREEERLIIYGYFADKMFWAYLGFADKTFWDYLELLIVPAALLIGGYLLNRAQREREREAEQAHRGRELEVEPARPGRSVRGVHRPDGSNAARYG